MIREEYREELYYLLQPLIISLSSTFSEPGAHSSTETALSSAVANYQPGYLNYFKSFKRHALSPAAHSAKLSAHTRKVQGSLPLLSVFISV